MNLVDFIAPERVAPDLAAPDKPAALAAVAALLSGGGSPEEAGDILAVLEARERLASTGVGHEVAIPHGKLPGIEGPRVALARCPGGVDFDSLDGHPVRLLFGMVAPVAASSVHLKLLARISRLTHDDAVRARLLAADGREGMLAVLRDEDARQDR